jgi:hypothetical protein
MWPCTALRGVLQRREDHPQCPGRKALLVLNVPPTLPIPGGKTGTISQEFAGASETEEREMANQKLSQGCYNMIKLAYVRNECGYKKVAKMFGVDESTVKYIVNDRFKKQVQRHKDELSPWQKHAYNYPGVRQGWFAEKYDAGVCEVTGIPFDMDNPAFKPEVDHKVPRSLGGTDDEDNLQMVVAIYNRSRMNYTHEDLVTLCRALV